MFSKVTKKLVATTLVLSLVLAAFAVSPADAATKAKLNKKTATISVGGKALTLKANASAKWSTSDKKVASLSKKRGKSIAVSALSPGTATITAKVGKTSAKCKVTVKSAASGTVVYDLAKETGSNDETKESWAPPVKSAYSTFKYSSFAIWLCRATFYDPANNGQDYRGKKLNCTLTFTNSGKRDLPELGFAFNYTKGGTDGSYPFALHISEKALSAKVKADKQHKHATIIKAKIAKGKTYTYKFSFTIPADAINGDKDTQTGYNYPIMFFLANLKDKCPYKVGDAVTIRACKWTVA